MKFKVLFILNIILKVSNKDWFEDLRSGTIWAGVDTVDTEGRKCRNLKPMSQKLVDLGLSRGKQRVNDSKVKLLPKFG